MSEKETMQDLVLRMSKKNRIVYMDLEGVTSVDLDTWLDSQPVIGLLYDLNRLPESVDLSDGRGVNDYAVGQVITRLHEQKTEALERESVANTRIEELEKRIKLLKHGIETAIVNLVPSDKCTPRVDVHGALSSLNLAINKDAEDAE